MASFSDPPVPAPAFGAGQWRGRARDSAQRLAAPRYLLAAATALPLTALALARFGPGPQFAIAAFVITSLCVLTAIDITERRLPNRIVLPSAAIVLAAQIGFFPDRALEWVVAAAAAAIVLLLPLVVYPGSVGMGDVKLMLLLGASLGTGVASALVVGSLAAAAYAVFLLVRSGAEARRTAFPLGPFLAFGAVIALLA
jgi:leader peptidase (prepilin peptidase)/N-methyltransferase